MTISERINKLRQERNRTQAELVDKLGIIWRFEAKGQQGKLNIQDRELCRRFELVDTPSGKERNLAKEVPDLVIVNIASRSWPVRVLPDNTRVEVTK